MRGERRAVHVKRTFIGIAAPLGVIAAAAVVVATSAGSMLGDSSGAAPVSIPLTRLEEPAAFSRARSAVDLAAMRDPDVRKAVEALTGREPGVPDDLQPGSSRNDARVLLTGLGASSRSIVAFTTSKGRLCLALTEFTAGCLAGLPTGISTSVTVGDPDVPEGGEGPIVWGYAASRVKAISVEVDETQIDARLANNVYFVQLPGIVSSSGISALVVQGRDGQVTRIPIQVPRGLPPPGRPSS